ncbi:MAG: surface protein, partial [Polaribacter sp.]
QNVQDAVNIWVTDPAEAAATYGHIKDWGVAGVTNMSSLFRDKASFHDDISAWDVSNVTNMSSMFNGASTFNQNLDNWDVSNVTDMSIMFNGASSFNQNLDNWDVSNVTDMSSMFRSATSFNKNVGNWDVSKVTDMSSMFNEASSFNQNIDNWNVSKVTDMGSMFRRATSFNKNVGNWDVSKVTDMSSMFIIASSFNQDISNWCVFNIKDEPQFFLFNSLLASYPENQPYWGTCAGTIAVITAAATEINATSVNLGGEAKTQDTVTARGIIYAATATDAAPEIGSEGVINETIGSGKGLFSGTISGFTANTEYSYRAYATRASGTTYGEVLTFTTKTITAITQSNSYTAVNAWFEDPETAESIYGHIKDWDVSTITDMSRLFEGKTTFNVDISGWDVSNVTNMSFMFSGATSFNQILGESNTSNLVAGKSLNQAITGWDVSNVTDMTGMFLNATSFNQNLSSWCVANIATEPADFAKNSGLQEANKPVWGACGALSTDDFTDNTIKIYALDSNQIGVSGITQGERANVELFDLLGKKVGSYLIEKADTNNYIQLNNIKTGVYLVRLKTGSKMESKKIFIQ